MKFVNYYLLFGVMWSLPCAAQNISRHLIGEVKSYDQNLSQFDRHEYVYLSENGENGVHRHGEEEKQNHAHEKENHAEIKHEEGEHEDHHDHHKEKFGPNKAIQEVKDGGLMFRLSEPSLERLRIETTSLTGKRQGSFRVIKVSRSSLVFSRNEVGLYLMHDRWVQFVAAEITGNEGEKYVVKIKEPSAGYHLVTDGVALLRVAQLEAMGKGGRGHVH
jgi:uncharacterized membrane protein YukC